MQAPEAVFLSYRLGGADGVGIEAAKWEWALRTLGFTTRRVAGELDGTLRPDDAWLPFLAIEPVPGAAPDPGQLSAALAGADLVVVENICSLPLNLEAATLARDALADHRGRVLFHHHDLPWERPHLAHVEGFPPERPESLHVTISDHARAALRDRGIDARRIHNSFDFDGFAADRPNARSSLGLTDEQIVLLQPTRAIPRKNVSGGLDFARSVAERLRDRPVTYWITGPPEDGFGPEYEALVADSPVEVRTGRAPSPRDAYAAADLVVFPSTWEGFGNPVIESVAARRMVAVSHYPVLDEITTDLRLLSIDRPGEAIEWLLTDDSTTHARLATNYEAARQRFSIEHLPHRISETFAAVGWRDW